jgi:D-cysteine desulfhydrase
MRLAGLPRLRMAALPTPLQHAPRLSKELGVDILIKRDDLTGLGVGGNKVRKLEYLVADALARGADTLVTGGGPQSNHVALTALAAQRAGLSAHLVFYGTPTGATPAGNEVLYTLAGAGVTYTGDDERASVDVAAEQVAVELRRAGRHPYVIPRGGATALGCAGYVLASLELLAQLADLAWTPARVVVATGSCGTQAGLEVGTRWLQAPYRITGVTVSRPRTECAARIRALSGACAELLGLRIGPVEESEVLDGYLGPGYGKRSPQGHAAMRLLVRTEGLLLDPVFTAKAMAALVDLSHSGEGPMVFWHTGGAATALMGGGDAPS